VSSPIDVGVGRGGFALSPFLDLVELTRIRDLDSSECQRRIGIDSFFSYRKESTLFDNVQVGFSL